MAWWAVLAVFLTGTGVVLIWRTLEHTSLAATYAGDAVEEARKATAAALVGAGYAKDAAEATKATVAVAERQASISRKAMISDQRPWLRIETTSSNLVRFSKRGMTAPTDVKMTNIGKTPAIEVAVSTKLFSTIGNQSTNVFKRFMLDCKNDYLSKTTVGFVIFPNDIEHCPTDPYIPRDELAFIPLKSVKWVMPGLIVSVCYRSTIDNQAFQTGRGYFLWKNRDGINSA